MIQSALRLKHLEQAFGKGEHSRHQEEENIGLLLGKFFSFRWHARVRCSHMEPYLTPATGKLL